MALQPIQSTRTPAVGDYMQELRATWQKLRQKLLAQAEKDKARADCVRRSLDIHVSKKVLLSTKHLQLKDKPGKLHPIFVGPF